MNGIRFIPVAQDLTRDYLRRCFPSAFPQDQAAISIQKVFRGFQARKNFLPKALYPQYKFECDNLNKETSPRAEGGKLEVYLPRNLPEVVLKLAGRKTAKLRFYQMRAVRAVIESQGFTHLVVPRARLYGEFLIEERLPVCIKRNYNAGLYRSHIKLFDEPVRQMVHLFRKFWINGLVDRSDNKIDRIRYDNIPFLLREKEGKQSIEIGLIDLEHIEITNPAGYDSRSIRVLVATFPCHINLIKEELKSLGLIISKERDDVIRSRMREGMEYLLRSASSQDQAAISIQKVFRGFQARKNFLPKALYPQYKFECDNLNKETSPRASGGKLDVYLPRNLPEVVLKLAGRKNAKLRFYQMRAVRAVIESQGFTHLVVPRARLYGEFLIEERLPVCIKRNYNADLYGNHIKLFDEPVRQMVRLFRKFWINALVDRKDNKINQIRYDNIPFLLREKEGKQSIEIGLIDLEHIQITSSAGYDARAVRALAAIFPFHINIIKEELKSLRVIVSKEQDDMIRSRMREGMRFLEARWKETFILGENVDKPLGS